MKKTKMMITALLCIVVGSLNAQERPSIWWQCENGNAETNYHPAVMINEEMMKIGEVPASKAFTLMVVYDAHDQKGEQALWQLNLDDSNYRCLTTNGIRSNNSYIKLGEETIDGPVISTLQQSVRQDEYNNIYSLSLGSLGQLPTNAKVSEVLYYNHRLGKSSLHKVQSYLAIKYGATLGPVDYVAGDGEIVWNYNQNKEYHHRIVSVAKDATYGLDQQWSHSECEGGIITLHAADLQEGQYIVAGDNNAQLQFENDGEKEVLQRQWKVCVERKEKSVSSVDILINASLIPDDCSKMVMHIGEKCYWPQRTSEGQLLYANVELNSNESIITFVRDRVRSIEDNDISTNYNPIVSTRIFPNPSQGHYCVEVEGAKEVHVSIYNTSGVVMRTFEDKDKQHYTIDGELPSGNVYYVTVTTEEGIQTTKLIVK